MRAFIALAALALTATPALAGCPTGADKADGVVLAQNEPFFMRGDFIANADGFVEQRVIDLGDTVQESMALYKHGLVMTGEHAPGGHVEINYVDDIRAVERLPDDGKVALTGVAKGPAGEAYVELELTFLRHDTMALAECSYDTWVVTSSLMDRDGVGARFELAYAPELDLVLAASQIAPDDSRTPTYAYQWAGTAADVAR